MNGLVKEIPQPKAKLSKTQIDRAKTKAGRKCITFLVIEVRNGGRPEEVLAASVLGSPRPGRSSWTRANFRQTDWVLRQLFSGRRKRRSLFASPIFKEEAASQIVWRSIKTLSSLRGDLRDDGVSVRAQSQVTSAFSQKSASREKWREFSFAQKKTSGKWSGDSSEKSPFRTSFFLFSTAELNSRNVASEMAKVETWRQIQSHTDLTKRLILKEEEWSQA